MYEYIEGINAISRFFGMNTNTALKLILLGGIPGAVKIKRRVSDNFQGGGRGVWALDKFVAEHYKTQRAQTTRYEASRVTENLLKKFSHTKAKNVPDLIRMGLITDTEWCEALTEERLRCHLDVPILMHDSDLALYLADRVEYMGQEVVFQPDTKEIFKSVRSGRKNGSKGKRMDSKRDALSRQGADQLGFN